MFGKVIVFGLFEMIQEKKKKSENRIPESGRVRRRGLSHFPGIRA